LCSRFRELPFNAKLDQIVVLRGGYSEHELKQSKSRTLSGSPAKSLNQRPKSINPGDCPAVPAKRLGDISRIYEMSLRFDKQLYSEPRAIQVLPRIETAKL